MPAPQAAMMKNLARLKFTSFAIKVPINWKHPVGDDLTAYNTAFKDNEKTVAPGMPPLFLPATMNKVHVDAQKMHIDKIGSFIDKTCDAICGAWGQWQSTATVAGVMIMGPVATLGQVVGPPWTPLILAQGAKETPQLAKYTQAIATVLGTSWLAYTSTIKFPGLPLWPAFAMMTSPVAPPMPSTPAPLVALMQVSTMLSAQTLKTMMVGALGDPMAPFHDKLFEAIAEAFQQVFMIWQTTTQVTNILGTGPVPTFAPPVVPGGPVVAGVGTGAPGCFV